MKSLAIALSLSILQLVAGFGCVSATPVAIASSPKGPVEITLETKRDTVRFTLGDSKYKARLEGINDSRCPSNAKCIWQGELAAELTVDRDVAGTKESKRFTLGELTAPSLAIIGASFEIVSISESAVTLRVTAE
ncbi:MAG: hypothetical protein ACSLFQ_04655 [Thermoanaerobaculia bacterium]